MTLDRRTLLALSAAAAASPAAAAATADPLRNVIVVNALGGLGDPNFPEPPRPVLTPRILADARASGTTAVNITIGFVAGQAEPFQASVAEVAQWTRLIRENPNDVTLILTAADIARAKRDGKIGVIFGFQNAAQMGDDASRVDIFADMGVRVIQLTYNLRNQLGDGAIVPEGRGLTEFGRKVVDRLNANRIMVDLSHSGRQICLDAIQASRQPISINHTGCRALVDLPRNKTDEELRLVAEKGGFVGIYFMPFLNLSGHATAADVVQHIEHAIKICGEDHVGIGTDGGTTPIDNMETYKEMLRQEHEDRKAKGVAAPGERADTHPFVLDLRGPDQFRKLHRLLSERGHKPARIEKILGLNFVRYARDIWGD
ncbi:membrane dipeptidase [Phenylobacterium sp. SCN 70-31]|uniref:dipeptidase n=1 Tax=Phenylobacterium sp. SCN 70-31 TaxID=1660129 RepID=UPI00086B7759|nr:membrane dipeptidase [Phenylobacterium sp. SCN 70-31]ODT86399.1 MAG: peptidase M19 [Phenylobacterium sp. SCN 70-31]